MDKTIPCDGCNMLAHDLGFTYDDLLEKGAIVKGKMIRHFTNCPFGPDAYPRVTVKQLWARLGDSAEDGNKADKLSIWNWLRQLFRK